jgi:hypothetical protein
MFINVQYTFLAHCPSKGFCKLKKLNSSSSALWAIMAEFIKKYYVILFFTVDHSDEFNSAVVLGSNPSPPQHMANSVSPEVGSHLGWHSTMCWPLRGGRGIQYTQKPLKM